MIYFLVFLFAVTSVVSIYYCIKFGLIILRVQDTIEESLDIIDEKYASITNICDRPLFYDSPEVRQVLDDVKDTRAALHKIAFSLSKNYESQEDEIDEGVN